MRNNRRVIVVIMGSFGPNGQIDKGRTRDLKAVELIEQGFAARPTEFAAPKPAPATLEEIPTVKTQKAPAAVEQSSTTQESVPTFRIIPPQKKP